MRIAIVGYGKLGHEIETIARERGHDIALIVDKDNAHDLNSANLQTIDVVFEFTTPHTAFDNVKVCLAAGKSVVCGTTGWHDRLNEAIELAEKSNGSLFYASNFSLGVNLFFRINRLLAQYIDKYKGYKISIEETHHAQKKDAPSGTAISLANIIANEISSLKGWTLLPESKENTIPIRSVREGNVTGVHSVTFNSEQDEIILTHSAKNRRGFALGAVLAAEFSVGKKGFLTMDSFLNLE
ncbi:MAG TPA: 4-hydroxy-tetrahydrodipicolinate reductase [Tenuifilaceae bacterium]|nr:4-hydroxy-tetrahydrodipicolinate reductase [Tenuifilaceae bacterium]